jgi:hypothetical protein
MEIQSADFTNLYGSLSSISQYERAGGAVTTLFALWVLWLIWEKGGDSGLGIGSRMK